MQGDWKSGQKPPQDPESGAAASGPGEPDSRLTRPAEGGIEPPPGSGAPRAAQSPGEGGLSPVAALLDAQNRMIQCYFRLQRLERKLSARPKPRAAGQTLRQIELERQRLGRELHTGIGQILAATRLQLETIDQQWPSPPPAVRQALDRIAELAAQALEQVRAVSRRLHPPDWQRLSLPEALRQLWDLSGLPQRAQARLEIAPDLPAPSLEARILLYRALQEALSNIALHSQATAVEANLEVRAGRLVLTVRDNGVGFDAEALWRAPAELKAGIGLRAIREQAAELEGELNVQSGAGGTTLEVSVPMGD